MTLSELKQAIGATLVLSAAILLVQAVPETLYWLVYGEWYGLDASKLLPEGAIQMITDTSFLGLNQVSLFLTNIWLAGLIAGVFALVMAGAVLTRKFENSDMMQDLLNPPTRREDIVQVHRRLDQISDDFENGLRELRDKILAVEDRLPDFQGSRTEASASKAREGQS